MSADISMIITKQLTPMEMPMHCIHCKTHLFSVVGDVLTIWQGVGYPLKEIPVGISFAVAHICRGCKKHYNFYFQV